MKNVYFLPMGGIEQAITFSFAEKKNKVVLFGSYKELTELEETINENTDRELIWKAINLLKEEVDYTIEEAFLRIQEENGLTYSVKNTMMKTEVWGVINNYIRQYFRQKIVHTIALSGIPIEIYGWGEDQYSEYANVQIKAPVSIEKMLEICREARFVLNIQPWAKEGTQERVFNAMLGESVCITDETKYLSEEFEDNENILFYKLNAIENLPQKILYYMENEQEAARIAANGYKLAKEKHTWGKRAEELSEFLKKDLG